LAKLFSYLTIENHKVLFFLKRRHTWGVSEYSSSTAQLSRRTKSKKRYFIEIFEKVARIFCRKFWKKKILKNNFWKFCQQTICRPCFCRKMDIFFTKFRPKRKNWLKSVENFDRKLTSIWQKKCGSVKQFKEIF